MTRYDIYEFEGFRFKVYKGPIAPAKLRKDGIEAARAGRKFWKAYSKWASLPEEKKEKYRTEEQ